MLYLHSFIACLLFVTFNSAQAGVYLGVVGASGSGTQEIKAANGSIIEKDTSPDLTAIVVGFSGGNDRLEFAAVSMAVAGETYEGLGFDWFLTFGQRTVKPYLRAGGGFYQTQFSGTRSEAYGIGYGLGLGLFWKVAGPVELEAGYKWSGIGWSTVHTPQGASREITDTFSQAQIGVRLHF